MNRREIREISLRFQYELKMMLYMAQLRMEDRRPFLIDAVAGDRLITGGWVSAALGSGSDELVLENAAEFFVADVLWELRELCPEDEGEEEESEEDEWGAEGTDAG